MIRKAGQPPKTPVRTAATVVPAGDRAIVRRTVFALNIVLLTIACLAAARVAHGLTADQWRADIDQLVDALETQHPMPAADWVELDVRSHAASLKASADTMSDRDIVLEIALLVARLNDGHTRLTLPMTLPIGLSDAHSGTPPPNDETLALGRLPVLVAPFGDDFHVTETTKDRRHLLGARLVSVNGMPIAEAVERIRPLAHGENDLWRDRVVADRLTIPEVLAWAGIAVGTSVRFTFEYDGRADDVDLTALDADPGDWFHVSTIPPEVPAIWSDDPAPYRFSLIDEALYFRFDRSTYDRALPPPDLARAMEAAREAHSPDRLIVDLRRNTGGNATWNLPFLRWIVGHPTFDRWGHLYVLISRDTFSAASLFVNELEQHARVIFVGEKTGSAPDHYGDARKVRLDNSGLTVRISTIHWKNWLAGEFRDGIRPHVPSPPDFDALLDGRDVTLEAAMNHEFTTVTDTMETLFAAGDVNSAAVMAVKAAADPNRGHEFLASLLDAGERHLEAGSDDIARYFFLLAETGFSEDPRPFHGLGRVALRSGDDEAARRFFETALERDPAFGPARAALDALDQAPD
jgi:hypothetical protein